MKVLHVIPSLSPDLGGPTEVALNLVKYLRASGVDAEIATTNDSRPTVLDVPLYERIEYKQVPVWFLPRFGPPMKEFIFSAALTRWLWQHVRDYDILDNHYLFSYAPTAAAAIARSQLIPYTVRAMGQLTPWALAQSRLKKQIYTFLIERHNLNGAAAIHCTCAAEAEDVRNFGVKVPLVTLPLGAKQQVDCPEAKQKLRHIYNISPETPVVLFLSRLHYKKRPDLLLHALSQLKAKNYDFHLILAGAGTSEYVTYLTNLVSSLNLADRTSMPNFVMGHDKDLLLQGSDIFVLPSFSENFGIAVAEAMAAGLPPVVTPGVQIAPEIDAAQAGLVVEGEVDAISCAIEKLLLSPSLRQQLSQNGKRLASERYEWSAIASQLITAYRCIIDRLPPPTHIPFS